MPILGIIASQNYVRIPQTSYESIATTTVGAGGTSTITFSSIPSTYTHLQIRMFARSNRAGNNESTVNLRINGQTSSYSYHRLIGDGSSASSSGGGSTYAMFFYGISSTANIFGAGIFDILDYTNTNKYKTVRTLIGHDQSGAGRISVGSGMQYTDSTAVSSITLYTDDGSSFQQYSSFALYGIKG